MLVLKENGNVYLAETAELALCDGYESHATTLVPENFQVWRVPGTDIVACVCCSGFEADILRFDDELITGDLTMEKLVLETVPEIRYVLQHFGKIDEDDEMNVYVAFAQGDKAFVITPGFLVTEVTDCAAFYGRDERALAELHIAKDMPPEERMLFAHGLQAGTETPVLSVIDTGTLTPRVIGAPD